MKNIDVLESRVQSLMDEGLSIRRIANELGIDKGKVERIKRRVK